MWIFTPWNDKRDYEEYKSSVINSHASLSGFGLMLFYPTRWAVRICILTVLALLATPIILSIHF